MYRAPVTRERVHFASISSLLSLLNFLVGTNTLLDKIPAHFVLDFLQSKTARTIKGVGNVKLEVSSKLNLSIYSIFEGFPMIVVGSFKFSFP